MSDTKTCVCVECDDHRGMLPIATQLVALAAENSRLREALPIVISKLLECVYMAADSSDYHGGGGQEKVDAVIAEVQAIARAALQPKDTPK